MKSRSIVVALAGLLSCSLLVAVNGCSSGTPEGAGQTHQSLVTANGTITAAADETRSGWYPNQPSLSPSVVGGATFGRLFKTALSLSPGEQVIAQPLVLDDNLFVVTEANNAYVLDAKTGAIKASRNFGSGWAPGGCSDVSPTVGITSTPVIDAATRTAYFFSKTNRPVRTGVAEVDTVWYAHAVDADTLAERPNFPVEIAGHPSNDPTITFTPNFQMQRPALLLMGGVVYAAFGAHCDIGPYNGFIVGVSTTGQITTMFATEAGPQKDHGAGIWQSGGGLSSDGPGRIFFVTGNGYSKALSAPIPSSSPPATLDESCVRVNVQQDGSLKATDFFAPYDALRLDAADGDFGAGAPVLLPSSFGTTAHPHLLLTGGKGGVLYLMDRDSLGGYKQGPGQGDGVVSAINAPAGMWSYPAVWSGEGGWAYLTANQAPLQALRYSLRSDGVPVFSVGGTSADSFGFSSSSPIITSDGTTPGSGLVWVNVASGSYGSGALRAYDAVPDPSGAMTLRYEDAYGRASKFSPPGVGDGRIYVGTSDGNVIGYGAPSFTPLSSSPADFGTVVAGASTTQAIVLTANQATSITGILSTSAEFVPDTSALALPIALALGQTLTIPVRFSPTAAKIYLAALNLATPDGPSAVSLKGVGITAGPNLKLGPSMISYGGVALGDTRTNNLTLTNAGSAPVTLTAVGLPGAPFSAPGAPSVGQVLAGGASVAIPIIYAPTSSGTFVDHFTVSGGGKDLSAYLSGTSAYQGALTIAPMALDFGFVPVGSHTTLSFSVGALGGTSVTVNKSKPPNLGVFLPQTTLAEGTVIPPGSNLSQSVQFAPTQSGAFSDHWVLGSSDGAGTQEVTFTGFASLGTGLLASYYNGLDLSGPSIKHLDPRIAFTWGAAPPLAGISTSGYSVHWEGQIQAIHDETYTFYTRSNQGVRLTVGPSLLIDNWTDHATTENFGQFAMQAGQKYRIALDYYQHSGQGAIELAWSSPSTPRQIVPSVALFPADDPAAGTCKFLALSRVGVSVSSTEGGTLPGALIDGDPASRWASEYSDPQWASVDLGSVQRVRRVVLTWQDAASKDYDIQVSTAANGPWSTIYTQHNGAGGTADIQILNADARYVRVYSRARTTVYGISLYEIEVYGDPSTTCGPGGSCGNGILDPGEQCDDGNAIATDGCTNSCALPSCSDALQNQGETGVDCGGPCAVCAPPSCTDNIQNQGETGVDCGGPCAACVVATCSDGLQNQGETGVDCGGPCPACVQATCSDLIKNQGETGVDCGGPCPACPTCADGVQNRGETGIDCGGPCVACGSICQALALTRVAAVSSSDESGSFAAPYAIDGLLSTRWASSFSDPQWLYVDLGAIKRVRRVVLRWETAAAKDFDVQVATATAGPWTTIFTKPTGNGGVDDITGLNANGRYVRMYSRSRTTPYGNSLYELEVYGDSSGCGTGAFCGNGTVDAGEQCDDGNTVNADTCSNACVLATCSDSAQNQSETGVDCGGPCPACATCSDGIRNQGETGIDCGGPCAACPVAPTCSDGIQNQGEAGVDCGGPCTAVCGSGCQSNVLPRVAAVSSTNESGAYAAQNAIDASLTTRWASAFADLQWIYVDLGSIARVRRVVLRWEAAAAKDYDVQVANSVAGPWTTIFTKANGVGGVEDINELNSNGRYVRMYARTRTTPYGVSLFDFLVYGDSNLTCGAGAFCGNGILDSGEQCDDGNTVNNDSCNNLCFSATCSDLVQNQAETGVDCGGPCSACATCSDHIQNQGETGVDCGGPCAACVAAPTCSDHIQNQGETGVDCGGPCAACVALPTCSDGAQNQGETGVDCGGPCPACVVLPTCSDGVQNQGEAGVDCGGPCSNACGGGCQSNVLPRVAAVSSSDESNAFTAPNAIDASLTTRWASRTGEPQWIYIDMGAIERVRRVVLRWELAAAKDYDIQVANSAAGPWTTIYTKPNGTGGVEDITGLNANGRYIRMYARSRTTPYGVSLFDFLVYGDSNLTCGAGAFCGNGVLDAGEQCDDGNTINNDSCSNVCFSATCSDLVQNQGEAGVDCGGPCSPCATCADHIQNQGETGVDCGGPCAACVAAPTCFDQIQNQGETGVDCGGPCAACVALPTCSDGLQNQGETGVDCGGPCSNVCGSGCQSNVLTRVAAVSSSNESSAYAAQYAIDASLTTRWASAFADLQWIAVDLGTIERVRRVVLRWEFAAAKDYDIQVANSAAGPWTTIYTKPNGAGGVEDITGLNANGRYVRMYARTRATVYGVSLYDFQVYGDSNLTCGP